MKHRQPQFNLIGRLIGIALSSCLFLVSCTGVVPGKPSVTTEHADTKMLGTLTLAPVKLKSWFPGNVWRRYAPKGSDYEKVLIEKIQTSGIAKEALLSHKQYEQTPGRSNLLLRLEIKSNDEYPDVWKSFPKLLMYHTLLGTPLRKENVRVGVEGSIQLIDLKSREIIFEDNLSVKVTMPIHDNSEKQIKKKLTSKVLNTVADKVADLIKKGLEKDSALLARARVISEAILSVQATKPSPPEPSTYYKSPNIGQRWALVIGVSSYADSRIKPLAYADDDAKVIKDWLLRDGFVDNDHIVTLIGKKANRRSIEDALHGFLRKADRQDVILVYWSGHGYVDPQDETKTYFACYNTDILKPWTGINMGDVRRILQSYRARNVVFLADTCHSGGIYTSRAFKGISVQGIGPTDAYVKQLKDVGMGTVFFVAGDSDRKALESSRFKNGLFTYTLLEALSGKADGYRGAGKKDKLVTLGEMMEYVEDKLPDISLETMGYIQRPVKYICSGDETVRNLPMGRVSKEKLF